MTKPCIELTEDQFAEQYPLLLNHLNPQASWGGEQGGCLFETYGEELAFVGEQDPRTVWTLIDGNDGDLCVLSGIHFVNRIGYLLSERPVPEGIRVHVRFPVAEELELGYAEPEVQP